MRRNAGVRRSEPCVSGDYDPMRRLLGKFDFNNKAKGVTLHLKNMALAGSFVGNVTNVISIAIPDSE